MLGPCLSICTVQLCSGGFDHFNDIDNFDTFGDFDEFDNCDKLTNFGDFDGFDNVDDFYDSSYSVNSISSNWSSSKIDCINPDPAKLQTHSLVYPTNLPFGYPKPNINLEIILVTFAIPLSFKFEERKEW